MTNRLKLLSASPLLLAIACGDLKSPTTPVQHVSYKTNGDIAAFLPKELVTLDGALVAEKQRAPFVGLPKGGEVVWESLSADGRIAAVAWSDGGDGCGAVAYVFRVVEQELLFTVPCVSEIALSPPGDLLAVHGYDQSDGTVEVRVHDVADGRELWASDWLSNQFVFSPDGTRLYGVTTGGSDVQALDSRTGAGLAAASWPKDDPGVSGTSHPAVSADGQYLVVALSRPDTQVRDYGWFGISDMQLERTIPQAPGYDLVSTLAISADGQRFAAIAHRTDVTPMPGVPGIPPRIQMWTASGELLYAIDAPFIGELAFSPDGSALVATPYPDPDSPGVSLFRVSDGGLIASHTFSTNPL
jgi:hypothetical protein